MCVCLYDVSHLNVNTQMDENHTKPVQSAPICTLTLQSIKNERNQQQRQQKQQPKYNWNEKNECVHASQTPNRMNGS